ncbi:MATE family efflux transporter, partial [Bradyrhizobium sp. NBAIM08]|nr:MATE family efflux transporter [Bradyrhizobium sp. BRP05]MCA1394530.1 MATE family efflux transporter [Bradyrhizobium sp. IC3123]MCA1424023.1 MATE family efflux transporter [Bradyrhizobium sp. BRP23]MCA1431045.1 MATE family efflux transporter [Bradyrhizobium sp. NBAIM16]MCA1480601.1 MATE family efflux transporter [Bradyrhizobium sp. NBAIM08]MCA1509231.1 MATE family efflux transporter [Bradyrhizobium sp. NBAIM02]
MVFVRPLVGLFSDSDSVREIAVSACTVFHLFFGLYGIETVVTAMLQSLGRARLSAVVCFARHYLFIPAVLFFPAISGFSGVLASQAIAELGAGMIALFIMRRQFVELRRCGRHIQPGIESAL